MFVLELSVKLKTFCSFPRDETFLITYRLDVSIFSQFRSSVKLQFFRSAQATTWRVFSAGVQHAMMTHTYRSCWTATRKRQQKCWIDGA